MCLSFIGYSAVLYCQTSDGNYNVGSAAVRTVQRRQFLVSTLFSLLNYWDVFVVVQSATLFCNLL